MAKEYTHLSNAERRRIERLRRSGNGVRKVAGILHRGIATVSEELKRNTVKGEYDARKASHKAYVRRKYSKTQSLGVVQSVPLWTYVEEKLLDDVSPEAVSGRIRAVDRHLPYVSTKAVYRFIKSAYGRRLERHLYSKAVRRKSGRKRKTPVAIDGRLSIEERPRHVEKRLQFGHFEGDFIESGRDGTGALLVLRERKTRYPILAYVGDRSTATVNALVARMLAGVPRESVTVDNDLSFQKHRELSVLIGAPVFFCHPQSPQEKGSVENLNKGLRRYFPKRSDLSSFSEEYIREIEAKLRRKPMKCLRWKTPQEAWNQDVEQLRQKQKSAAGAAVVIQSREKLFANWCSA